MSGWKDWAIGEVVTESEFQSFVQDQVVQVYDDATDRDNTLGANVAEGMMCYLKDIDETQVYDGTDWVSTVGDITEVVAGTALTGGGSSGSVTLNVDESEITLAQSQVTDLVTDLSNKASTTHATTHESGGTDELSLDGSQVSDATPTSVGVVKGSTVDSNVSLGAGSLSSVTSGLFNVAVGVGSLELNQDGIKNTGLGRFTLSKNISGNFNVAIGDLALQNSTGSNNVAIGERSMRETLTGDNNIAVGHQTLRETTTGSNNTAVGLQALRNNTTGDNNVAVGQGALQTNTTGGQNIAVGSLALSANSTGDNNVAVGRSALINSDSTNNQAIGLQALSGLTTGDFNSAIGRDSGNSLTTGSNNSFLGSSAQPSSISVSNEITLGNGSITALRCNATLSSLSDQRDKTNIQDSALGLDLIQRLRPVTFDWDRRDGSFAGRKDVGFIAQDVVEVEDELDIEDTLRMSYRENPEKLEVAPARLIPVLTKAIQELSEQNAELKARLDKLEGK